MFKTLYSKLAMVLLALFCGVGAAFIIITLYATDMYQQEVGQRLNRDVAKNIVAETEFFLPDNQVNQEAIAGLFHNLMVINPVIEIYLLDPGGHILAFSAKPGKVKRKWVNLTPILAWLEEDASIPQLGDDPRGTDKRKVFSAARVPAAGKLAGYLYVIIGGEQYDTATGMIQGSYILKLSSWMIIAGLFFALLAGLLLFAKLTGRLRLLAERMESFRRTDLSANNLHRLETKSAAGDEIDRLTETFGHMANRIEIQVEELTKSDSLRRELVANVSHDLRTPLATLQGYIETLLMKDEDLSRQERHHYLTIAIRHCERLSKLVADLFELARLDSQEVKVQPEPFSLAELLQDVIQKFQLTAKGKNISLLTNIGDGLPFVHADIGMIERVLENLIENALRHTPAGGTVSFVLTPTKDDIMVQVRDTGAGIPKEDVPHIFKRFYQVDANNADKKGSAGLGLAITKRILELHGCGINVESAMNSGTCFSFQLPVASRI